MPDSLSQLFDQDREAYAYFMSLPMFTRDQIMSKAHQVTTREELSALANQSAHDAMTLPQYAPLFEDETDSGIDLM